MLALNNPSRLDHLTRRLTLTLTVATLQVCRFQDCFVVSENGFVGSNEAALEPLDGNDELWALQHFDQPVEDNPLIIAGSRQ